MNAIFCGQFVDGLLLPDRVDRNFTFKCAFYVYLLPFSLFPNVSPSILASGLKYGEYHRDYDDLVVYEELGEETIVISELRQRVSVSDILNGV